MTPAIIARSLDDARGFGLCNEGLDLLIGDSLLDLPAIAERSQDQAPGNVEQPDRGGGDLRKQRHGGSQAHRDPFRIAQRDLLGHEFPDDQRHISDRGDNQSHADDFRDRR